MNKRIFNETKTQELFSPDLTLGCLQEDKLIVGTEPAVTAVTEQGHYQTVQEYPNGGKDVKWVVTTPGVQAKQAQNIYEDINIYVPYTLEQIEQQNKSKRSKYMDAYRKYQASVNYGEFQRAPAVDYFIQRLRSKDWTVLENIPTQIKYFAGEIGLSLSGLIPANPF